MLLPALASEFFASPNCLSIVFFVRRCVFVSFRPRLEAVHGLQYEEIKR
jgi:hypothetical protein